MHISYGLTGPTILKYEVEPEFIGQFKISNDVHYINTAS